MNRKIIAVIIFIAFQTSCAGFWNISGISVIDGDTIAIDTHTIGRVSKRIRLYGIDAPEIKQPYGPESKKFLEKLIEGKKITVKIVGTGIYGRSIGMIFVDGRSNKKPVFVNAELVKAGYAWVYPKYCRLPICAAILKNLEKEARLKRIGLFKDSSAVKPWIWRRKRKQKKE